MTEDEYIETWQAWRATRDHNNESVCLAAGRVTPEIGRRWKKDKDAQALAPLSALHSRSSGPAKMRECGGRSTSASAATASATTAASRPRCPHYERRLCFLQRCVAIVARGSPGCWGPSCCVSYMGLIRTFLASSLPTADFAWRRPDDNHRKDKSEQVARKGLSLGTLEGQIQCEDVARHCAASALHSIRGL